MKNTIDKFWLWIARHLPDRVVYYAYVRVVVFASSVFHDTEITAISPDMAAKAWMDEKK